MKRLIFILLLLATPVLAQKFTSTIVQPHTTQATDYTVVSSPELTTGTNLGGIRVTCTTACYITVASPVANLTVATGIYLPADLPFLMIIGAGARIVKVTAATTAGTISITEF